MKINRRMFLAGSASTAALLALAACSKTDGSSGSGGAEGINAVEPDKIEQGGELKFAITAPIANWNANTVAGNGVDLRNIYNFVFPYFFDYDDKGVATPNPDFLASAEAEEVDGKTVVSIELNPKAVWGSGKPISPEDFEAFYAAAKSEDYSWASTDGIEKVEKVEKESDTKFKVIFESPYPDWTAVLASCAPVELMKDAETFNTSMEKDFNNDFFSGPFKIESWDATQEVVTLTPNDKWWGEAPKLDKVTFRVLDDSAVATSFANSEIDVIQYIINADAYSQASGRSDAEVRQAGGLQWRHFTINAASGPLSEEKVRQAIMRACDREAIAKSDLAGLPVEDISEVMLGNRFFMPSQEGYKDNSGPWSYDVEAAKKLLDEAGWMLPEGGEVREKDGKKLEIVFTYPQGASASANEGTLLQSQLKEVGISLSLNSVESDKYFTEYVQVGNYEMTAFTWQKTQYPMANVGQIYGTGSGSNYSGQSVPEIDDLIAKIDVETDNAKRVELTNQVDELVWEHVLNFPMYERREFTAVPKRLANFGAQGLASYRPERIGYVAE
ncbi:ABC transporter family substrate-binding protein [Actinomyces capricornis]|uniref:Peptide ABC transporter substrate-binding protein n=1 Tax=Actinomyces capricornis TaxID=2755559 RepID=A0ABN6K2H0_9ACTO|nr:ABC transporter family substrate-binding protein [Actinomyces capricornis]BDA63805.1 peptide ABC transporter substrate-binding protein [Actinomyces capricornis]